MQREPKRNRIERLAEAAKLRRTLEDMARQGRKLVSTSDRLWAAAVLTLAWQEAQARGVRKADVEEEVLGSLARKHEGRGEFRLKRYTLRRDEAARIAESRVITKKDRDAYKDEPVPQKSLDAYITALRILASKTGADPDERVTEMLRSLDLWKAPDVRKAAGLFEMPEDDAHVVLDEETDEPAETLAIELQQMTRHQATASGLQRVLDEVRRLPCRWDMFANRLADSPKNQMDQFYAEDPSKTDVNFEEMIPYPSVPLVRIPTLAYRARFALTANAPLTVAEAGEEAEMMKWVAGGNSYLWGLPLALGVDFDAPLDLVDGRMIFGREVRLAVAPVDRYGFGALLEVRPFVRVEIESGWGLPERHEVRFAYEPFLARPHFLPLHNDGQLVWPVITRGEQTFRIFVMRFAEEPPLLRGPSAGSWDFSDDDIDLPDEWATPGDVIYQAATPVRLRQLLDQDWSLGDVPVESAWMPERHLEEDYGRNLPPPRALCFPDGTPATDVERCLHNGLLEAALKAAIDHLAAEVRTMKASVADLRDHHAQRLLKRWPTTLP